MARDVLIFMLRLSTKADNVVAQEIRTMLSASEKKHLQEEAQRLQFLIETARRNGDRDEADELTAEMENVKSQLEGSDRETAS